MDKILELPLEFNLELSQFGIQDWIQDIFKLHSSSNSSLNSIDIY